MGKTFRHPGWKRTDMELIRIFFQTVPQNHKKLTQIIEKFIPHQVFKQGKYAIPHLKQQ